MPLQAAAGTFRSLVRLAILALLALAGLSAASAAARDFEIRYHERLKPLRALSAGRLSFVAYGRQFDLLLESNAGIVAPAFAQSAQNVTLYRGRLAGHEDSWVRLSETDGRLAGAIWDGTEIWLVDSGRRIASYLLTPESVTGNDSVIFRLSEVSGTGGDFVARAVATAATHAAVAQAATAPASFGPAPGRILDIGLVAATDFRERHGNQANNVLLEMFNVIEGIFITQVGVQLRAVNVSILDSTPGELLDVDPQTLLRNFGDYKLRSPELSALGLAHLFVSRDLDDTNPPTRTVGMANLAVTCDRHFGVGITQATHATILDALIAAHEIGHNLGAPHDAEAGSACAAEPRDFIMAPKINGSTRFSQCSIEQMLPEILGAGCMREIPPTDLQLTLDSPPPAQVNERQEVEFSVLLSNLSNTDVAGLELNASSTGLARLTVNADAIDDGYCDASSQLQCVWPWLRAGASVRLNMSGIAETPGTGAIDVTVDSLHEVDASDNALHFDIEVLPLAELLSLMTPGTADLHPGESVRFEAAISNRGDLDATGVVAHISIANGLSLDNIELPGCTANADGQRVVYTCPIGTVRARRSWSFGFSVSVPQNVDLSALAEDSIAAVGVFATSDAVALADADRSARATVTIGETISNLGVTIDGRSLTAVGEPAVWQIEVSNHGPDAAESIRIFDTDVSRMLPSNAVQIETSSGECALNGSNTEFECSIESLGVGEKALITLTATPTQPGQYFWIEAAATSSAPDGDPGNNRTSLLVAANSADSGQSPEATAAGPKAATDDDNGGGGSTSLASLIALLALLRARPKLSVVTAPAARSTA